MKKTLHKADTRGFVDHGWLSSRHTFSFAEYRDPERIRFGLLRVINDDVVQPSMGFSKHPHENMEIVSIPLAGASEQLERRDGIGIEDAESIDLEMTGDCQLLVVDVPMQ